MIAELITIGDELLIGQVVNTNASWMAKELNEIGVRVGRVSSISDDKDEIIKILDEATARADVLLLTGGLGPTRDDITKHTLAAYFKSTMVTNPEVLENVKNIFSRFNAPLLDVNIKQAEVPDNCIVLHNPNGTAPGMLFHQSGKVVVSMPGVPFEMMEMMKTHVLPYLKQNFSLPSIVHHTLLTAGIGESFLAKCIEPVEDRLPKHIKLAYLPKLGQVRLRLSGYGDDRSAIEQEILQYAAQIKTLAGEYVVSETDTPLHEVVLARLSKRRKTIFTAESCTGGYLAHLFTSISGASASFLGGVIPYSNVLKTKLLGVSESTLSSQGAVSEEAIREMAAGALDRYGCDYVVATSGIAGPSGGTEEKPVGTVWIAVGTKDHIEATKFQFGHKRMVNIERAITNALTLLIRFLEKN